MKVSCGLALSATGNADYLPQFDAHGATIGTVTKIDRSLNSLKLTVGECPASRRKSGGSRRGRSQTAEFRANCLLATYYRDASARLSPCERLSLAPVLAD